MRQFALLALVITTSFAFEMDLVCSRYAHNISKAKCSTLKSYEKKLRTINSRMSKEEKCKIIKQTQGLFDVADNIIEGNFKAVGKPTKGLSDEQRGNIYAQMLWEKGATDDFIAFIDTFTDLFNTCYYN